MATLERESVEANVESTLLEFTTPAGATTYGLPKPAGLVTRELLDYDETRGKRPAAIIQVEHARTELVGLSRVGQTQMRCRVVWYFDLETNSYKPVTWANMFIKATREALLKDRSRGANPQVLTTRITDEPVFLLWKMGQAFEATLIFEVDLLHEEGA